MRVNGKNMSDNKMVEKLLLIIPMKFDYVVTTIIKSPDTDTLAVEKLQNIIESHVNNILEKIEKIKDKALRSQVNLNNIVRSSQIRECKGRENFSHGKRRNFRGRYQGTFRVFENFNFNQ